MSPPSALPRPFVPWLTPVRALWATVVLVHFTPIVELAPRVGIANTAFSALGVLIGQALPLAYAIRADTAARAFKRWLIVYLGALIVRLPLLRHFHLAGASPFVVVASLVVLPAVTFPGLAGVIADRKPRSADSADDALSRIAGQSMAASATAFSPLLAGLTAVSAALGFAVSLGIALVVLVRRLQRRRWLARLHAGELPGWSVGERTAEHKKAGIPPLLRPDCKHKTNGVILLEREAAPVPFRSADSIDRNGIPVARVNL